MSEARIYILPGDPAVIRDVITGENFHLESSVEAATVTRKFNELYEEARGLKEQILALESDLTEAEANAGDIF